MEDDNVLSLEWPNFEIFLGYTFQELRHDTDFGDVTLVCESNERITAHKVLLSASSLFFKNLFLNSNQKLQLEFKMNGIDFKNLSFVMDFIYTGEVQLLKSELDEFMTTSKALQLKGMKPRIEHKEVENAEHEALTQNTETLLSNSCVKPDYGTEETISELLQTNQKSQVEKNAKRKPRLGKPKKSRSCCELLFLSYKPWKSHVNKIHQKEISCANCGKSLKANNHRRHVIECTGLGRLKCPNCSFLTSMKWMLRKHMVRRHLIPTKTQPVEDTKPVLYKCSKCDHVAKSKKTARNHKNTQHSGIRYSCNQCKYESKTQTNVRLHKETQHDGVRYACEQCQREFTRPAQLRVHIGSAHEGRRYNCDNCDITCSDKSSLNSHIKRKHQNLKIKVEDIF